MYATYTLTKEELNYEFLDNLKRMIDSDEILLSIESYDETEYLKSSKRNHKHLLRAIKNVEMNENLIEIPFDDILKTANEED
jgi:hypothetical protein